VGLVLRAALLARYPHLRGIGDETIHYATGVLTAEFGLSVLGQWAPLYDAMLAGVFRIAGPDPLAPKLLQVALSPLPIVCAYALARAATSERAGRIAAWLLAVDPSLVAFSHYLYTETLFVSLLLLASWALFRRPQGRTRGDLLLAGVLFGLTILTRSVALYFLAAWAGFEALRGRRREAAQAALVFAVALAVVLPWTLRNAFKYHDLLLVDGTLGRTAYFAFSEALFNRDLGYVGPRQELPARAECQVGEAPGAPALPDAAALEAPFPEGWHGLLGRRPAGLPIHRTREFATRDLAAASRCELGRALAFMGERPGVVAGHGLRRFYAFWGPNSYLLRWVKHGFYGDGPLARSSYPGWKLLVVGWHVALVACAILAFGRRRVPAFLVFSALFVGYYTAVHMLAVAHSRYRLPVMPFVMIATATWLADPKLPEGRARAAAVSGVLLLFVALSTHYALVRLP
jgi:4-amino-4-deoxy-L-arabinose transferase-like glycosyltransferase